MIVARTLRSTLLSMSFVVRKSFRLVRHSGPRAFFTKARRKLLPLRVHRSVRARTYGSEALKFAERYDATPAELRSSRALMAVHPGQLSIQRLTWYLPHFEHADYGGIRTILRFAAGFAQRHGVENTFVVSEASTLSPAPYRARIQATFPALVSARVVVAQADNIPRGIAGADACVATHWTTAYAALRDNQAKRKYYLIQDLEPLFFPAGSISAQIEATYRFGFYGIANTETLRRIYQDDYGGRAIAFQPCVETDLFAPAEQRTERPYLVFFYARPDHPRNGFELGITALRILKQELGSRVRIVAAGHGWRPAHYGLDGVIENLGLLSYQATAELYQQCDAGLTMMFTRHPSYLPLELMASGCLVVSNVNQATGWLLRDRENCLLALPTPSSIAATLAEGLRDTELRRRVTATATQLIRERYADWDREIERVYQYLCDPEAFA